MVDNLAEERWAQTEPEERYRALFDRSFECVYIHDFEGNLLDANPAALKLFGYTKEEIRAMDFSGLLTEDQMPLAMNTLNELRVNGYQKDVTEFRLKTKQGQRLIMETMASVIYHDQVPVAVLGIARDITAHKRAQELMKERELKLHVSEKELSSIINHSPDIIYRLDPEGTIIFVNDTVKAYGYSKDDLIGQNIMQFVHPDDRELALYKINERRTGDRSTKSLQLRLLKKDSGYVCFEDKSIGFGDFLIDAEGIYSSQTPQANQFVGTQGIARDISERKHLEARLQQTQKMEALGTLSGGIAHDFNNILSIIQGNTELANGDIPEWSPAKTHLKEIRRACGRAKEVIQQILSFSRRTESEMRPVDIAFVIQESVQLLRASIPSSIDIRHHISADVTAILGDPTQLHQVLLNLCSNGAHAMEEAGGILDIELADYIMDENGASLYPDITPGPCVKLTVKDTGHGMAPDMVERIFEPYFTTKEAGKGTGMGLSVVHGIVKSHGGTISVSSTPGEGTMVEILFPAVAAEAEKAPGLDNELPRGNERILFLDDEKALARLNKERLERLGYEVETRTEPLEALERFRSHPDLFDLIITDTTMPRMTGDRLAEEMMKIRRDIPILLCTGYSDRIDKDRAKEMGIAGFAMKPLDMGDLARTVRDLLDSREDK